MFVTSVLEKYQRRLKPPFNISQTHPHTQSEFCSILLYQNISNGSTKKGKQKCSKSEGALTIHVQLSDLYKQKYT